jgi:hypothetical protein
MGNLLRQISMLSCIRVLKGAFFGNFINQQRSGHGPEQSINVVGDQLRPSSFAPSGHRH